jgi:hypothetical protein
MRDTPTIPEQLVGHTAARVAIFSSVTKSSRARVSSPTPSSSTEPIIRIFSLTGKAVVYGPGLSSHMQQLPYVAPPFVCPLAHITYSCKVPAESYSHL